MQKRILAILLCVFLGFSFAACGTTPENPTDTSGSSAETTVNSSSDSGSTSDSVSVTDSVSSGTVTDGATDSVTDSVTDILSSATTDSDAGMTDESGGAVDSAPGGDGDMGMGDYTDTSGSGEFSDYNPDDFYGTNTDTGIWGGDTSTDTSGGYTDTSTNSGGSGSDQTPEPDQNSGSGSSSGGGGNSDNSTNSDTPLWSDTNSDNSNTQDSSDDSSSDSDSGSENVDITAGRKFLATDITNYGIVIYDLDACKGDYKKLTDDNVSVFWEWTYSGDPNGRLKGPNVGIDSAKLRYSDHYKRDVVIACSSYGWAGVIDYETCTLLWECDASDLAGAHSLEMLPNGDLVVGTSSSNKLVYIPLSAGIETPTHSIGTYSTHGVSWDPTNNCLWVLDYKEVYAVKVENPGPNGKLKVVDGSVVSGFVGGHAFSPVAGSPGKYWIGAGGDVFQFDTKTKKIEKESDILQQYGVKGIASFADGTVVLTGYKIGGKPTKTWSSDGFRIVTKDGKSVTVPFDTNHREFYKVQPFTRDYQ